MIMRSKSLGKVDIFPPVPPSFLKAIEFLLSINLLMGHIDWLSVRHLLNMIKSILNDVDWQGKRNANQYFAQELNNFYFRQLKPKSCFVSNYLRNKMKFLQSYNNKFGLLCWVIKKLQIIRRTKKQICRNQKTKRKASNSK